MRRYSYAVVYSPVQAEAAEKTSCVSLPTFNMVVALFHLAQFFIVVGFVFPKLPADGNGLMTGRFPMLIQYPMWERAGTNNPHAPCEYNISFSSPQMNGTGYLKTVESGTVLDTVAAIAAFFVLSFAFQIAANVLSMWNPDHDFLWWSATLRYVEYSITASLMIVCIGVQVGILQVFTLLGMGFLTWATMLLGLLTHFAYEAWSFLASETNRGVGRDTFARIQAFLVMNKWLVVLPHLVGWVTCIVAYYPILHAYQLVKDNSPDGPPDFVNYIVNAQFGLFIGFGFVQLYEMAYKLWFDPSDPDRYTRRATLMFICLSLIAKSILAWLILSPVLARASNNSPKPALRVDMMPPPLVAINTTTARPASTTTPYTTTPAPVTTTPFNTTPAAK